MTMTMTMTMTMATRCVYVAYTGTCIWIRMGTCVLWTRFHAYAEKCENISVRLAVHCTVSPRGLKTRSVRQVTVIVLYLLPETLRHLEPFLSQCLQRTARCVVTVTWPLPTLPGTSCNGYHMYYPEAVSQ